MNKLILTVTVTLILLVGGCASRKSVNPEEGAVVIRRPEQQGLINVLAVHILADGEELAQIEGGKEIVLHLKVGRHLLSAASINPYSPKRTEELTFKSDNVDLSVSRASSLVCILDERSDDSKSFWSFKQMNSGAQNRSN